MSPPAEPRPEAVQVTFIDFPAAIGVSENFTPLTTSYPTFLSLLSALSGSVAHKLDNLPHQHVQGQGFTLSDGGWWYRFVKPVNNGASEVGVDRNMLDKGPWTLLDCLYGYEKLVGELCLGIKWSGACVEVQHNLQKKRDDPGTNKAQEIGTDSQISQQASLQYHPDLDSASTEPYFTTQDNSRNNTGAYDGFSTVKDALRSGYDSRITSQEFHGSEDVGQDEDEILVDEGPGPSVDESTKAGKLNTSYNPPLIVTSPFVGTVPPEDDDEDDSVTPTPKFSTPVAKATPEVTQPNIAESNTELVKGPAGITYLPVYLAQPDPAQLPSEIGFNSKSISRLAPEPEPKFYPPPPRATGSPNDKYRQVPRSGGAVRNPKHQPFKYQYGGPDQQLMGGALLSAYNQQQQFPFPLQKIGQSQYNSPAGTFNQNVNFVNQSQRLGSQQRQPFDPRSSSQGSYRERARGKYDVRKARGGYDKNTESNKYSSHSQYQNSSRPAGSGNSPTFPLDPALEVNYRNYRRQNNFNDGHGQYSNQNNDQSQYQNQNQYAEAPHFGYSAYGNVYGIGNGNDNGYPYTNPAPPAFNINSNYYAPSAFAAQEQEMIPSFSPEIGMMAPTQMAAPPTQEQLRQPFVPSPFAATFTPRFTDIRQEHAEQAQDQGQEYAIASEVGAFQYQLQGYGMLPLVPGPFANVMPLPMPTAAELISQAPHLIPYERPKPVVSMPPMGEFSPPRARKTGRQAKKIFGKVLAGNRAEATGAAAFNVDEGNENAVDDVDADVEELDDGDDEYIPKNEGRKKKKPKNKRNKRGKGLGLGLGIKDEAKAGEGKGDGDSIGVGGTEATATATAVAGSEAHVEVDEDEMMTEG